MSLGEFETYVCEYDHEGERYAFRIVGTSFEDAHARLQAIRVSGKVDGVLMGEIPAFPGAGLWARFLVWWNNLRRTA